MTKLNLNLWHFKKHWIIFMLYLIYSICEWMLCFDNLLRIYLVLLKLFNCKAHIKWIRNVSQKSFFLQYSLDRKKSIWSFKKWFNNTDTFCQMVKSKGIPLVRNIFLIRWDKENHTNLCWMVGPVFLKSRWLGEVLGFYSKV